MNWEATVLLPLLSLLCAGYIYVLFLRSPVKNREYHTHMCASSCWGCIALIYQRAAVRVCVCESRKRLEEPICTTKW